MSAEQVGRTAGGPGPWGAVVAGSGQAPPEVERRLAPGARVDALIRRAPLDRDAEAGRAWLAEVDAVLLAPLADLDQARLLELRAAIRANLPGGTEVTADFYRDSARAARLYERSGRFQEAATNYVGAAVAAAQAEDVAVALDSAVRGLVMRSSLAGEVADPIVEARMVNMFGVLAYQFFDYSQAAEFYESAVHHTGSARDLPRWSVAVHNLAEVLVLQARDARPRSLTEAAALLDRAEELSRLLIAEGEPAAFRTVDGPRLLAAVLCDRDQAGAAWTLLEQAAEASGRPPVRGQVGALRLTRGRCLLLLDRAEDAVEELDAALEVYDPHWDFTEHLHALQLRSRARERTGDHAGALRDARCLAEQVWGRQQRQVGGFMAQVWTRAGLEGERRDLEARARDLVRTAEQDPLTTLANRRALHRFLDSLPADSEICLLMVDVDHFKRVNDQFGHLVGDEVLRELGVLLGRSVRAVDRVSRWGGEEFLLALPGGSLAMGLDAAARVRDLVAGHEWSGVHPSLRLTVSIGVADGPIGEVSEVLERCDAALYRAKRSGRDRIASG